MPKEMTCSGSSELGWGGSLPFGQTWKISQVPQPPLCKMLLSQVKCNAEHTIFVLQFSLFSVLG